MSCVKCDCKGCKDKRIASQAKTGPCKGKGAAWKGCPCGFCKDQPINHQPKKG